jgi:hypothetical protein
VAYSWITERMVEEHRRDLTTGAVLHPTARNSEVQPQLEANPQLQAYALDGEIRRHFAHQVGTLLIRAGTRLGGASMRTS